MQLSCVNENKAMFETRNKLTAKITALETENEELREEITDLTAKVEEFSNASETVAGLNAQIETVTNEFATAKAEWEAKESKFTAELEAAQAKSTPEAIQAAVTEELAKCSHKPVEVTAITENQTSEKKEVSRDEFNAMTPSQKSKFSINGGKIKG